jgi:hypothetical protein
VAQLWHPYRFVCPPRHLRRHHIAADVGLRPDPSPSAFMVGLMALYLGASELIAGSKSKGEVKVYPRTRIPKALKKDDKHGDDVEGGQVARRPTDESNSNREVNIQKQTAVFHFEDLCYEVPVRALYLLTH